MTATWVINAFSVLVLLTPWLCGQNPDELLVVRLPAKYGRINEPGAAPVPSPTMRGEIAASGRARRCGSMAAGRSPVGCFDRGPSQPAGEGKLSRHCTGKEDKERTRLAPEPKFPAVVSWFRAATARASCSKRRKRSGSDPTRVKRPDATHNFLRPLFQKSGEQSQELTYCKHLPSWPSILEEVVGPPYVVCSLPSFPSS